MLHYRIEIRWSEPDQAFLAEMPELKGCIADGPTPQAAVEAVLETARIWLDIAREKGWTIPEPRPLEVAA